jgi:hypothetical protein
MTTSLTENQMAMLNCIYGAEARYRYIMEVTAGRHPDGHPSLQRKHSNGC